MERKIKMSAAYERKNTKCQFFLPATTILEIKAKAEKAELSLSKFIYSELIKVYPDKNTERSN